MKFFLKVYHSVTKLQVHELTKQLYFIGRSEHCHIRLESNSRSHISRCHITLVLNRDGERFYYSAYDGNVMNGKASTSGLFVDKIKVASSKKLQSGNIIDFVQVENKQFYPFLEYFEESELEAEQPTSAYDFEE